MIHYFSNHQIDKRKWDTCIDHSLNGRIYAYSWYLDIVSPGWDALVEDDYLSVFPLTYGRKFGIKYLFQPFFTQQLGLFSTVEIDSPKVSEFLLSVPEEFSYIEIHLNEKNPLDDERFTVKKRANLVLNLSLPYADLQKSFNQNTRRNLKKAAENEMFLSHDVTPEELIDLFRRNFGEQEGKLSKTDYGVLEKLMNAALERKTAALTGIRSAEGSLLAGVSLLTDKERTVFHFAASSKEGKHKGAMFLLMGNIIEERAGTAGILDFEGSEDENVARFYRGFGAADFPYFQVRINRLSWVSDKLVILAKKLKSG